MVQFKELSKQLIELAEAAGESLPEFEGREFSALAEFEQPLVEASIRLRSVGSNELSLQLLDAAVVFGVRSGLVDDNRAWALAGLGRRTEAMGLWNELLDHPDEGRRTQAQANLRLLAGELSKQLIELAEAAGESLPEFEGREFSALAEFEQPLVEASIRLRSVGSNELSLQLLDAAVVFGVRSGLVDDNRAWALAGLGRRTEAMGLWNELLDHPDEGRRTQAQANLRLLAGELSKQLIELAEAAGESLPEFEGREFSALAEFEQPLVEASIRLRSVGSNELSLQLLDAAVVFGVRSGLVDDNRAWALAGLGRLPEAVGLWRELQASPEQDCAAMARERLQSYASEADRIVVTNNAQVLVDEGHIDQAKTVLLQAMMDAPEWDASWTTMLIHILKTHYGYKDNADLLERELKENHLSLEVFDLYLDLVEQRLKDVVVASSSS
ncbi:hypothetical protein Syncc9605_0134 [Synechococcus sp. CC9605]|nr:hypothetical protein Syncc9605_0134 [Synechococcus sp. CC9605]